ncbi:hypothetical protein EV702DRAFT_188790 [Suillus placidus]|uniref:Uncharacterized protein n=1 Tax=Suillus placidus TaxID=48579 RepID=A0A9P6ZYG6_9AGAM|nr:hypothetical protein EV702DRAFT_188790 [Suillus placidus]
MSRYLRIGPGVLACPPRSYYSGIRKVSSHCAVPVKPRPHLVKSDGASVLNMYYHVKPQPCYTKPHSDWVKHFPTLDKFSPLSLQLQYNTNVNLYAASRPSDLHAISSIAHVASLPRHCIVNAASHLRLVSAASNLRVSTSAVSVTLGPAGNRQWGLDAGQHHRRWNVLRTILLALFNRSLTYVNDSMASYSAITLIPHLQMSYVKLKLLRC